MPVQGYDLGLPLYEVYDAGVHLPPLLASVYANANIGLANTQQMDAQVFSAPSLDIPSVRVVSTRWAELRDRLQAVLSQTSENITLTGQALVMAVNSYSATDTEAWSRFGELMQTRGWPDEVVVPEVQEVDGFYRGV
jgi:hypothetical protein